MRIVRATITIILILTMLTGCGATDFNLSDTVAEVNVNTDTIDVYTVGRTSKLVDEKIDRLVNGENLVGWDNLKEIPDQYVEGVLQTIATAEQSVVSQTNIKNTFAETSLMDYINWVFNYYSEYRYINVLTELIGYDDATQTFVVDVTYKTDNSAKKNYLKVPDIIRGEPNEDIKRRVKYLTYIESIENKGNQGYSDYYDDTGALIYGYQEDVDKQTTPVIENNDSDANTEEDTSLLMFGTATSPKTSFLVGDSNSEVTIRWIVSKLDTIGILQVTSAYVVSYSTPYNYGTLDKDLITPTLSDFASRLNICENDVNYQGLYKLYDNFGRYAEQYTQLNACTYTTRLSRIEGAMSRNADISQLLVVSELSQRIINGNTTMGVYLETAVWTVKWTENTFKIIDTEVISLELKEEYQKIVNDDHMKITDELRMAIGENNEDIKPEIMGYLSGIFGSIKTNETSTLVDPTKTISQKTHLETVLNGQNKYDAKYTFITDWAYTSDIASSIKLREYYILGNTTLESFSDIRLNKYMVDDVATWFVSDYETTYIVEVPNNAIEYYSGSLEASTN